MRVWRHLDRVRQIPVERRRFWLYNIARHRLCDHYRRQETRRVETLAEDPEARGPEGAPVGEQGALDTALDIEAAMRRLPARLRTVLVMHALGGMTSTEIGEALGRPPATVRYQLAQARRQLIVLLGWACAASKPTLVREAEE